MGFPVFAVFLIVTILGVGVFVAYSFWWCENEELKNGEDIQRRVIESKIAQKDAKSYMTFDEYDGCLVLNNDNKLFNVRPRDNNMVIKEIILEDILDVKIDIHTTERNSMKIISIVPTFDKCQFIQKINMIITTENEVYDLTISKNRPQYKMERMYAWNPTYQAEWNEKIKELNRLKLLIEKNMRSKNQEV